MDQHSLLLGGYQTYSLESYPDGETAEAIASEVHAEFLSAFPDSGTDFTHLGIGVRWNLRGGLHAGVIAAKRLVTLPGDLNPSELEKAIHSATNEQRAIHGYSRLAYDPHLAGIARTHSRTMATEGFFAHEFPDGSTMIDRYRCANYDGQQAGENIAKQSVASTTDTNAIATSVVDGWMDSPGHRDNILTSSFEVEGIGLYQGDDGTLFVTQNFG
ncbi:CAP domain-containing protein [Halovenus aranensis]|uniref:CAP domain-containing protein n=1 Tax=Halovenus aranensis TaxID=890420 RepID=UPI0015A02619|nr:CAP domain-containing protein [Halovenus aranensis]